jgi:hypothetical protein
MKRGKNCEDMYLSLVPSVEWNLNTWDWNRMETHEESLTSCRSLWVRNLVTDEGDPDRRNVQTELADWIMEIESNSRYRKYKESAHVACLTNCRFHRRCHHQLRGLDDIASFNLNHNSVMGSCLLVLNSQETSYRAREHSHSAVGLRQSLNFLTRLFMMHSVVRGFPGVGYREIQSLGLLHHQCWWWGTLCRNSNMVYLGSGWRT